MKQKASLMLSGMVQFILHPKEITNPAYTLGLAEHARINEEYKQKKQQYQQQLSSDNENKETSHAQLESDVSNDKISSKVTYTAIFFNLFFPLLQKEVTEFVRLP
jgi:hypothetical protein